MTPPKWIPRDRQNDPEIIHTHSIISHRTRRGIVVVEWGDMSGQFDPEDARVFAHTILRECDNAETDAFLYSYFKESGLPDDQLAVLLIEFRKDRAIREQLAGVRKKGRDEVPEDDRR